ncbi:hypothetical protein ACIO6T_41015 [Streptomyces sp. NPDC087532]|uniref:hypothetical protein n=1 Tax=Streptomyces sp. NPDC087532 TaxID=3365795 RepID=UPI0038074557
MPEPPPWWDEPHLESQDNWSGSASRFYGEAEADLHDASSKSGQRYATAATWWLESCVPDWCPCDVGDWQEAARQWHHATGLPIHRTVQDRLYERHGPECLTATRELDDLVEAIPLATSHWTGQDLVDLSAVTLAAMDHGARPQLRTAAYSYLEQLGVPHSPFSETDPRAGGGGTAPRARTDSWLIPAVTLAQHAGIDRREQTKTNSLPELSRALTDSPSLDIEIHNLVNARSLGLAAAAGRVIRARLEGDPKAEARLNVVARRRLEELAGTVKVLTGVSPARRSPTRTTMTIVSELMRTALNEEHQVRLERHTRRMMSSAGAASPACATTAPRTIAAAGESQA